MGRLNLTALKVRQTAVLQLKNKQIPSAPKWLDIVNDVPPAQILVRQQPIKHQACKIRTRTLPNGKTEQYVQLTEGRKRRTLRGQHKFSPMQLQYEEDTLRQRFFSDHPWELARPRVVVETSGEQHKSADWSTGLIQPGIPLSGESVVQRQLWLLENVPDITTPQAYDIARREFYSLRRHEEIQNRIAAEEARHMGAQWGKTHLQVGMTIENKMYNDWERWARQQLADMNQRAAAFEGTISSAGTDSLKDGAAPMDDLAEDNGPPTRGVEVFAQQRQREARSFRRETPGL